MNAEILSSIEFQMSLLLFVALAGYLLASRINQSAVVGVILVGIIIGPSVLGLVTYTDFVRNIAQLGAIIMLFVVGLEFKMKDIFNFKYGVIALFGVVIPWVGGFFLTKLFGFSFGSAIFVGTALTATSIAITASVLKEMGKLHTDTAKAVIGAAVIDDILGLLALSFTQQLSIGNLSYITIGVILLKSLAFVVICGFIGNKYLSRLVERVDKTDISKNFPEFIFIFAMMIAFLYALIAEYVGLSAIVGGFLAGVALENVNIRHGKSHREGAEYLHIIFASIFFVSLGVLVDFREVTSQVIWFLSALTLVAVLTKVIGCYIPSRIFKMSHRDSMIIGFGMSPRGEVAMIVALLGLNAGIIQQNIYISLVIMSLLTTMITPIILRNFFYKNEALVKNNKS